MSIEFEMFPRLAEGRKGGSFVYGDYKFGYLKVKVDDNYVGVGPFDDPDMDEQKLGYLAMPSGTPVPFFTKPLWKRGQQVIVECYDSDDKLVDSKGATVF